MPSFQTKPNAVDGSYVRVMRSVSRGDGTVLLDAIEDNDFCAGAYLDPDNAVALAKHLAGADYVVIRREDAADAAFTLRSIEHKGSAIYTDLADKIEGL